ncbi:hypothetical protein [uncultured Algibacter sp.]|uniref:hypothetical protein n=1 Tax=uncultured Algibacter sp. TaxID=298659 RepID=UPI002609F776|nr:hypothetical protein [uncultured Algibacter sp.]
MREIAEVAKIIRDTIELRIEYNGVVQNFTYQGNWVNEIQKTYFDKTVSLVVKQIDEILDYDNPKHIDYVKGISNKLKRKLIDINTLKTDNLENLDYQIYDWDMSLVYPVNPPKEKTKELWINSISGKDDRYEYVLQIIAGFFDIDYDNPVTHNQEELNLYLFEKHSVKKDDLQLIYAKAHLAYIIELHRILIFSLHQKFQTIIEFIEELEQFKGDYLPQENTSKKGKLYYKGAKYELAFLFNFLYDYDYVIGSTRESDSIRYIKHFINESEMYFFKGKEPIKVAGIVNDFGRIGNGEGHVEKEIKFTEKLIENLEKRLDELNDM